MRVTMEAVLVLSLLTAGGVRGGSRVVRSPQQITQEVLLTPFHLVRQTGNTAFQTGQQFVHAVPDALNVVSDAAVSGVDSVPHTVNTVSDLTVDTINSVGQVPVTAFRVTGNALRAGASALTRTPAAFT